MIAKLETTQSTVKQNKYLTQNHVVHTLESLLVPEPSLKTSDIYKNSK